MEKRLNSNLLKASFLSIISKKLVDCLEKCLIYGHIRRFADWFYYSFTTFNELSLDMQKHLRSCRINHYTTLRGTSKRKNKISTTYKAAFLTPTQENRNAAFFMPSCYAVRANKALIYAALRARKWERQGLIPYPSKPRFYCVTNPTKGVMKLWQFSAWKRTKVIRLWATTIYATRNFP